MLVGILGINHKSAELALREEIARAATKRFGVSFSLFSTFDYVLLSTCNRTEIYFSSEDLTETHSFILNALREEISVEFEHKIYTYFGTDCFLHLAKVTSGFDSAVIGETEIQGQVKTSYERALSRSLSSQLHFLFQKSLKIGKQVRTKLTACHLPTLEEATFATAVQFLGNLQEKKVLFVGTSEINLKILKSFKKKRLEQITLCNRTDSVAENLSCELGLSVKRWDQLYQWPEFDLIIFGTSSPDYLVRQEGFNFLKKRVIVDLGVPRNVDPKLRGQNLTLLNIDQIVAKLAKRRAALSKLITDELDEISMRVEREAELFRTKERYRQLLA